MTVPPLGDNGSATAPNPAGIQFPGIRHNSVSLSSVVVNMSGLNGSIDFALSGSADRVTAQPCSVRPARQAAAGSAGA